MLSVVSKSQEMELWCMCVYSIVNDFVKEFIWTFNTVNYRDGINIHVALINFFAFTPQNSLFRASRKHCSWTSPGPVASENRQALIFFRQA